MTELSGIHHVTAIASDPQRCADFYSTVLGLRLVKRTVNFDDPMVHHLYFGDASGSPGSLLTFFAWPRSAPGRQGPRQVGVTSLSTVPSALGFWIERFLRYGVAHTPLTRRTVGGETERVLAFRDPDGLLVEIVGHAAAEERRGWRHATGIAPEHSLRGLHGVALWVEQGGATERILVDVLGFRGVGEGESGRRYAAGGGGPGTFVDVREVGGFVQGVSGPGTVHHVAFRLPDATAELRWRSRLLDEGLAPTPLRDRKYFRSVYFNEPGGVLFELATDGPGMTVDETSDRLGARLMLPEQYEPMRAWIEETLPPVHAREPMDEAGWLGALAARDDDGPSSEEE